ncbi:hypothetical protein FHR85_000420 [Alkalibacillus almallahensis]|nr:hypothetical protein [Alkalibacillus almallahensis]
MGGANQYTLWTELRLGAFLDYETVSPVNERSGVLYLKTQIGW